ncbi:hypothetical protein E0D81_09390 [Lelliottia amnigena]|nr:hypothetical protein E0D81_09390 [Lelliottia amnigena]
MMIRKIIFITCVILLSSNTQAKNKDGDYDGNDLYEAYKAYDSNNPTYKQMNQATLFMAYVRGVSDVLSLQNLICYPDNVTVGQALDIVGNYLRDNPEKRNMSPSVLVGMPLMSKYPCSEKNSTYITPKLRGYYFTSIIEQII